MPRGILPLSQPDVRLVSPMQAAPSFFGLGKNLFLSVEMAANCHPTGFGKNSKQTKRSSFRLNDNRYQCCDAVTSRTQIHQAGKQSQVENFCAIQPFSYQVFCDRCNHSMDHAFRKSFPSATTLFQFCFGFASERAESCCEESTFRY